MTSSFGLSFKWKKKTPTCWAVSTDTSTHCSGETLSQEIQVKSKKSSLLWRKLMWEIFHTCYKMNSDQVFVLLHASVLKLDSEVTFISAFSCKKKTKKHCVSFYFTQCRLSVRKDACAELIADLLERQTHGISGCTKRSCFKNTQALPFSSKWLQPHYSTWRSLWVFIHYTTLSANRIFVFSQESFFFLSCNKHIWYNIPPLGGSLWFGDGQQRRWGASSHNFASLPSHSLTLQVLVSAGGLAKTHCIKVNVLLSLDAAEREGSRNTSEFVRGSGFKEKLAWLESRVNTSLSPAVRLLEL